VLGAALQEAERRNRVPRNVARLAYLPPVLATKRTRRSLTAEQARKLLAVVKGQPNEALVLTSLMLGLRPGEVIASPGRPWTLKRAPLRSARR
jgi:integrase